MNKKILVVLSIANLLLLAVNGIWLKSTLERPKESTDNLTSMSESKKYPLLSKRIFAENQNDVLLNFVSLRKQLETRFNEVDAPKSFYFEYLPSGTSVRIGENTELIAASLIKVPLTMNLYKAVELGKINLDKTVTITESEIDGGFGDLWEKGAGTKITLREAARLALSESDNTAMHVIFDATVGLLPSDQESLNNLDIDQNIENGQAVINAKSYASILKSLYLSSYLQRQSSEEILSYLSKSTATNRLTAKLPSDTTVAHKIGVYNSDWSESDCGIIYAPKRPYMVCIMVGLPDDQANKFIADTSKLIYDYVISQ